MYVSLGILPASYRKAFVFIVLNQIVCGKQIQRYCCLNQMLFVYLHSEVFIPDKPVASGMK